MGVRGDDSSNPGKNSTGVITVEMRNEHGGNRMDWIFDSTKCRRAGQGCSPASGRGS